MRWIVAVLVTVSACTTPPPTASEPPGATAPPPRDVWAYSWTLLRPSDPTSYENVIDAVVPLRDGGWIVLSEPSGYRALRTAGLGRKPLATLLRLDASGAERAREHGAEPFALTQVRVFEDLGLVIGIGPQVRNGSIHAFDLRTLDGRWSELGESCVAIADRCWTWRTYPQRGTTALAERDARTYQVVSAYYHLGMDGLSLPPGIYPEANTFVWIAPSEPPLVTGGAPRVGRVHVAPLDVSRPAASWRAHVESACWAYPVAPARLYLVSKRDCDDREDERFATELFDVSTGRALRTWSGPNAPYVELSPIMTLRDASGALIDTRDGTRGPDLPGTTLLFDPERGLAVVRLASGGAAVYRRGSSAARRSAVSFVEVARVECASLLFALVAPPHDPDGRCPALAARRAPSRLTVTLGRRRTVDDIAITGVVADPATRELSVHVDARGAKQAVAETGIAKVIELDPSVRGQWLVRLDLGTFAEAFVVDLP